MSTVDKITLFAVLFAAMTLLLTWLASRATRSKLLWLVVLTLVVLGLALDFFSFFVATSAAAALATAYGLHAWMLQDRTAAIEAKRPHASWLATVTIILGAVEALAAIPVAFFLLLSPLLLDAGQTIEAYAGIGLIASLAVLLVAAPVGGISVARSRGPRLALLYLLLPLVPLMLFVVIAVLWRP